LGIGSTLIDAHTLYVIRADRRVKGLVAEGWVDGWGVRYGWIGERKDGYKGGV
jgi:hypothetical protein